MPISVSEIPNSFSEVLGQCTARRNMVVTQPTMVVSKAGKSALDDRYHGLLLASVGLLSIRALVEFYLTLSLSFCV